MPAELLPQYTTIDYVLPPRGPPMSPIFLFVVDTCLDADDLAALRDELIVGVSLVPSNALVGLITVGTMVFSELNYSTTS